MKSLPDYSAYHGPESLQPNPRRSSNGAFEIILMSVVLGAFFSLLTLGMMLLGMWSMTDPTRGATGGVMSFDANRLALFFGIGIAFEGAAGGFLASLVLLSILEKKSLGRVMGLTLLIHSIAVSVLSFLLGAAEQSIPCSLYVFVGGSFAITCALIARRTQDMPAMPPVASGR